jgi:abhydrolase domain-containing protein 14
MSGTFALPLAERAPERFGGLVPIAPAPPAAPEALRAFTAPVLVVWGSEDSLRPVSEAAQLAALFPDAETLVLEGARHPCYLDRPDEFHARLSAFARAALGAGSSEAEARR